jgi:hypothetical protein
VHCRVSAGDDSFGIGAGSVDGAFSGTTAGDGSGPLLPVSGVGVVAVGSVNDGTKIQYSGSLIEPDSVKLPSNSFDNDTTGGDAESRSPPNFARNIPLITIWSPFFFSDKNSTLAGVADVKALTLVIAEHIGRVSIVIDFGSHFNGSQSPPGALILARTKIQSSNLNLLFVTTLKTFRFLLLYTSVFLGLSL